MVFILGANQTTLTLSSSFFFFTLFVLLLSLHAFFFNVFSLDVCWNGAGRHYSCQHSVSLPLLKSFTENQTFFFSLNVAMELTFFATCLYSRRKKSHQFRLHCFFYLHSSHGCGISEAMFQ